MMKAVQVLLALVCAVGFTAPAPGNFADAQIGDERGYFDNGGSDSEPPEQVKAPEDDTAIESEGVDRADADLPEAPADEERAASDQYEPMG